MKCKSCGKDYSGLLRICPFCGTPSYDNVIYPNKVATFLARPRDVGSFCVTNMNILLVFAINLSIAALIINLFTYASSGLWCQYVICGAFAFYGVMRGFFGTKTTALRTVRDAILFLIIALAATATAYNFSDKVAGVTKAVNIAQYAIPAIVIALGLIALVFLFVGLSSSFSFAVTSAINTGISTALLIAALVNDGKFTEPTVIFVAFGFSLFTLANYVLLRILSFTTRVKRGY